MDRYYLLLNRENFDCVQFFNSRVFIVFVCACTCPVVEPLKRVQPSKAGSKSKLQKTSSVSVNRSRSDTSTRNSSSTLLANTLSSSTGPAVEREAGRKRGQERLCRDLLRTLAETHFIHAEVVVVFFCCCMLFTGLVVSAASLAILCKLFHCHSVPFTS